MKTLLILFLGTLPFLQGTSTENKRTSEAGDSHTVTVMYPNLMKDGGVVEASVYDQKNFLKKGKALQKQRVNVSGGSVKVEFTDLPPGQYAVVSYHDVNSNNKLDKRKIMRTPKEPVAVSNMTQKKMRKPKFREASFTVNGDLELTMVWVKY